MNALVQTYGPWAIVTGASQGIGEGFVRELAKRGMNIILTSRRPPRLEALANALSAEYKIETRVVKADLSVAGAGAQLMRSVEDLDVGLVISNAGGARMGGFLQNSLTDLRADLFLNVNSHLEIARSFAYTARSRDRRAGLLLVSSTAALQPMALGAGYSAAKAFVLNLGESLHRELAEVGVDVTVLLPGPTNTDGLNHRDDIAMGDLPMSAMSVERLVDEGLSALEARRASHIAGFMNRWIARLLPRRMLGWMFSTMLRRNAEPRLLPSAPLAAE